MCVISGSLLYFDAGHSDNVSDFQVQTLLKVAKTNLVVVSILSKGHQRESKVNLKILLLRYVLGFDGKMLTVLC